MVSRFPAAFRLPAFASRSSDSRRGIGPSSRSAYRASPDPDGVTAFRTHEQRPGWVPSIPRGQRCSPGPIALTDPRLPHRNGMSLYPAPASHPARLRFTRHQRGFKQFTRPVFPSPAAARVERALLRLSPELRTPPTKSRTTHVGVGTGQRARTRNNAYDISRTSNPACLLVVCDLASHGRKRASS